MELTKYAKLYLDRRLTGTFDAMPEKYEEFIKNFGTHYFQDAFFGGMLKLLVETESSYFETSTTVGVGLQAEGLFGQIVKLKGGVGVSNTNVDGNFKKSSRESMRFVINCFASLSVCLSVCLSLCLSVCLSVCLALESVTQT